MLKNLILARALKKQIGMVRGSYQLKNAELNFLLNEPNFKLIELFPKYLSPKKNNFNILNNCKKFFTFLES